MWNARQAHAVFAIKTWLEGLAKTFWTNKSITTPGPRLNHAWIASRRPKTKTRTHRNRLLKIHPRRKKNLWVENDPFNENWMEMMCNFCSSCLSPNSHLQTPCPSPNVTCPSVHSQTLPAKKSRPTPSIIFLASHSSGLGCSEGRRSTRLFGDPQENCEPVSKVSKRTSKKLRLKLLL